MDATAGGPAKWLRLTVPTASELRLQARPQFADEVITRVTDYVQRLAIPRRESPAGAGANLFERAGCADCHTRGDHPVRALAGAWIYCAGIRSRPSALRRRSGDAWMDQRAPDG